MLARQRSRPFWLLAAFVSLWVMVTGLVVARAAGTDARPAAEDSAAGGRRVPLAAALLVGEPGAERAGRIAFVCDASIAAAGEWDAVRAALAQAVSGLRTDQSFVLLSSADGGTKAEWVKAGVAGSRWAEAFLKDVRPSDKADLAAAVGAALRLKPDAVLVLADARSVDAAALARQIKEALPRSGARVDLAVIGGDSVPEKAAAAMKDVAASTGGAFRSVGAKALARAGEETAAAGAAPATAAPPPPIAPPPARMFSAHGDAASVTFVLDASGSMLNKMATLKNEIEVAVNGLKPGQSFNIIFFQDNKCVALSRNALVSATQDNKRKAFAFLDDVTTSGTTDPMPGLTLAFSQHPQVLYLLTDGDFPDNKAVKDKVAQLNRDHKTKVNTVAFVGSSDTDTEFFALLEDIAKTNGGTYRHVDERELEAK